MAKQEKKIRKKQGLVPLEPTSFLHHPHDNYVRFVLQIKEIALDFIKYALPHDLYARVNMARVELSHDTFIDGDLRAHYSDITFEGFTLQDEPLRISIIIEHKSHSPKTPVTEQLMRYISATWTKDIRANRRLSLVIPILVYHGQSRIKLETINTLFPEAPPEFWPYIPKFDYVLLDVTRIPDSGIDVLPNPLLVYILKTLKYGRNKKYMAINWKKTLIFAPRVQTDTVTLDILKATILYVSAISSTFNEKLQNMDTALTEAEQKIVKPYVFELYDQGIKKGLEQGMEKGMEKGVEKEKIEVILSAHKKGISIDVIAEIVNYPVDQVRAIIKKHK